MHARHLNLGVAERLRGSLRDGEMERGEGRGVGKGMEIVGALSSHLFAVTAVARVLVRSFLFLVYLSLALRRRCRERIQIS